MTATLRLLTAFACALLSVSATATDYIFTGNGEWTTVSNWSGGIIPSGPIMAGNTIIIRGNVSVNNVCSNCSANTLLTNGGTLVIETGATLTLQNLTQFTQIGELIVNGTLINKTALEIFTGSAITINGTLINQKDVVNKGTIVVASGGKLENQLTAQLSVPSGGSLIVNAGGTIANKNSSVLLAENITNNGTIENGATLVGNTLLKGNLMNAGTICPGNGIGKFELTGNYTASTAAMHNFEVGGTYDTEHDRLTVAGSVQLNGVLNVTLANGFVPSADHEITIITGKIVGTFSSVFKPAKYTVVYNSNSVVLRYSNSLPMLYIKLDVKKEGNVARLSWEIHNEPSVIRYEIERSADGKYFQKIGTLDASQIGKYSFTDNNPKEKNYYRIKVLDVGGNYRYSSVMSLHGAKTAIALNVYPSPAQRNITVQHATAGSDSKIVLISLSGQIQSSVRPPAGAQQTSVNLSTLQKGMYILQFQNGAEVSEKMMFCKQ